jgi:hypothetical protein
MKRNSKIYKRVLEHISGVQQIQHKMTAKKFHIRVFQVRNCTIVWSIPSKKRFSFFFSYEKTEPGIYFFNLFLSSLFH